MKESPQYPIGTVARLSGFSTHQLRKWESRLGLLIPDRADNGRRYYTVQQLERLKILRRLINSGYRIGDLAKIGEDQWYTLDPDLDSGPAHRELRVSVVGTMICAVIEANAHDVPTSIKLEPQKGRLSVDMLETIGDVDVLVSELRAVTQQDVDNLLEAQRRGASVLIVFGQCDPEHQKTLLRRGVVCLKAPVPPITLIQQITIFGKARGGRPTEGIPERRYSNSVLSRAAAMSNTIKCECPKHVAKLLGDITNFEEYSLNCQNTSPEDQALHEELRLVAAQSRLLFEGALEQIADAEGIDLSETLH